MVDPAPVSNIEVGIISNLGDTLTNTTNFPIAGVVGNVLKGVVAPELSLHFVNNEL